MIENKNNDCFIVGDTGVLFIKDSKGFPQPVAVNVTIDDNGKVQGKLIANDPILMEAVKYVSYVRKQRNKKTGKYKTIPLFPYQMASFLLFVTSIMYGKSVKIMLAWARQSGKSELIKLVMGWCMVFPLIYMDTDVERFNVILGSHEDDKVVKLFKECKKYIYLAVDYYNETHKDKLLTKRDNSNILDNSNKFEIDKLFANGERIPYSQAFAITCSKSQDSLTSHVTIIDEAGLINDELFNVSIAPFSTTTAGFQCYFGVPGFDSSSLLHKKYLAKNVKNIIFKYIDIYTYRMMVNKTLAENYKSEYESACITNGKNSASIKWNYEMDFMDLNGKFCTEEILENSNVMTEKISQPFNDKNDKLSYLCAGLDISPKKDFRVLTCMKTVIKNGMIYNYEFEQETYNKDKCRMEHEVTAEKVAQTLKRCKIDMVCVDATAQGLYFVQTLRKKIKEIGINTLIVPYSYNGVSKAKLFGFLEETLFGGQLKLLKKEESWESQKLIEEMCYMIKEKGTKDNDSIRYYAPIGETFSDDHMNSLALANICYRHTFEMFRNKQFADDGAKKWRIYLNKFKELNDIQNDINNYHINTIWDIPL